MKNNLKITSTIGLALLLGGLVLVGCESDAVAPNDALPELTLENVAYQAAMVDLAVAEIAPVLMDLSFDKRVVEYNFDDYEYEYVDGVVYIDYRLGGEPAEPDVADYAHLYTTSNDPLTLTLPDVENSAMMVSADIMADLDQEANTAEILMGSQGSLVGGDYDGTYMIEGMVVGGEDYPSGGDVTFIGGDYTLVSTFDGTHLVLVTVDGTPTYWVDLDAGELLDYVAPAF